MTLFRTVREHMKGRTIVVVAHDMRTVMEADYIIVLNSGSLEAAGTHEELLGTSPTYRAYLLPSGSCRRFPPCCPPSGCPDPTNKIPRH